MMDKMFDIRLISEFYGEKNGQPFVEWIELVCEQCKVTNIEWILLLHLRGGALVAYQQLSKEKKAHIGQVNKPPNNCIHSWHIHGIQTIYDDTFVSWWKSGCVFGRTWDAYHTH